MYCKNCGADIPEGAAFCSNCGMKVSQESEPQQAQQPEQPQQPEQQQGGYYGENPSYQSQGSYQSQPTYYQQPAYNGGGEDVNATLWIVLSALEIITCCSIIPGIIGLVFSINANSKKNQGDFDGARADIKKAKIAFFVGIGLVVVSFIISFISGMAEAMMY